MSDFETELKNDFLDEAAGLLEDSEQGFLNLESSKDDPSIMEALFRLAHNLKGSARAVGFEELAHFTHQMESLFLKLKNKELQIDRPIIDLLLRANDMVKISVQALKQDFGAKMDAAILLAEIAVYLNGGGGGHAAAASTNEGPSEEDLALLRAMDAETSPEALAIARGETPPSAPEPAASALVPGPVTELKIPAGSDQASKKDGESPAAAARKAAPEEENIRVSVKKLERLVNDVGELVILQTVLDQHRTEIASPLLQRTISQLSKIAKELQDNSLSLRMIPLKQTFSKMQRIVRDTSQALNKDMRLVLEGEETELDKTVVEQLGDPLVHMIRNSVDHGVETPEERRQIGKNPQGTIHLKAYHRGGHVVIEVRDDGKGLDAEKLRLKAIEKGIVRPEQEMTKAACHHLIFAAGFSTKAVVTDISGRGVGMDVVKTSIEKLQGRIELDTELGKGTTFRIFLPLTLAIIDGMVVEAQRARYVVPMTQVFESLRPTENQVHFVTGLGEILHLRGENLPLYRLENILRRSAGTQRLADCVALVVRSGDKPFSVLVDDIVAQQQIVIKRLGSELSGLKGFGGSAILGDGKPALILDLNELITHHSAVLSRARPAPAPAAAKPQKLAA